MGLNVEAGKLPKLTVQPILDSQNYLEMVWLEATFKWFLSCDEDLVHLPPVGHDSLQLKNEGPHG